MIYDLPLSTEALQIQNFTYQGYDLTMTTRWNSMFGFWNFDLFDNSKREYIVQSEALVNASASLMHTDLPFVFVMNGDILNVLIMDKEEYRDAVRA